MCVQTLRKLLRKDIVITGRAHKPGEACLELLGDKGLKIGQLKEALLMNNLRLANQIMFEENGISNGLSVVKSIKNMMTVSEHFHSINCF